MFKKLINYLYMLYLTNPILNPSVVKVIPITTGRRNNKSTRYRLYTRNHYFEKWKEVGDFDTFEQAMNKGLW